MVREHSFHRASVPPYHAGMRRESAASSRDAAFAVCSILNIQANYDTRHLKLGQWGRNWEQHPIGMGAQRLGRRVPCNGKLKIHNSLLNVDVRPEFKTMDAGNESEFSN
jgi:hypothetical protein